MSVPKFKFSSHFHFYARVRIESTILDCFSVIFQYSCLLAPCKLALSVRFLKYAPNERKSWLKTEHNCFCMHYDRSLNVKSRVAMQPCSLILSDWWVNWRSNLLQSHGLSILRIAYRCYKLEQLVAIVTERPYAVLFMTVEAYWRSAAGQREIRDQK